MTDIKDNPARHGPVPASLRALLAPPPRAAGFIVTIYGDVVEPRGGVLWVGALIALCAGLGISETLVRTAVSRLVAGGRLTGERSGRRSFYRLTPAARVEFLAAAQALFGTEPAPAGWLFLAGPPAGAAPQLRRAGFALAGGALWLGADRPRPDPLPGLCFRAPPPTGSDDLRAFASRLWDLEGHAAAYRAFLARFAPLKNDLATGAVLPDALCLMARLALVNDFRTVLLRDPRLPPDALPDSWPGGPARSLFADLYAQLSAGADAQIGASLAGDEGPLPSVTAAVRGRLSSLRASRDAGGRPNALCVTEYQKKLLCP